MGCCSQEEAETREKSSEGKIRLYRGKRQVRHDCNKTTHRCGGNGRRERVERMTTLAGRMRQA